MNGYVWKSEWCWPYESAWSIIEKFKYANAVTNNVLRKLIDLRSSTPNWIVVENLYIYRRSIFNEKAFFDLFGLNSSHFLCLDLFHGNDYTQLLYSELRYCSDCINLGYHSYLHQLKFVDTCPFHNHSLKSILSKGIKVPYSIDTKEVEAYSTIQDRETVSAEKYIDILPARKLIDGIWDSVPKWISLQECKYSAIRYFNPSSELLNTPSSIQDATMGFVKKLFYNYTDVLEPVIFISQKECKVMYDQLLKDAEKWCVSIDHRFLKDDLENWYLVSIIDEFLNEIDKNILDYSIANMELHDFHYSIDMNEFIKSATIIWSAFIATNARTLQEGLDKSLIFRYDKHCHSFSLRCRFAFMNMLKPQDIRNGFSSYINFLIYRHLFYKLYKHIFDMLTKSPHLALKYYEPVSFAIHDYVIASENGYYSIYEI